MVIPFFAVVGWSLPSRSRLLLLICGIVHEAPDQVLAPRISEVRPNMTNPAVTSKTRDR
jgi:hypothetical protein